MQELNKQTISDSFRVRTMRPNEMRLVADWAAAEGWNPGLADAACFAAVDPKGFLVGELDSVPAAQGNYQKSGFTLAYRNIRFGGRISASPGNGTVSLAVIPFEAIEADDATVFPAPRPAFLRAWIGAPGHVGSAVFQNGRLCAWGVIRPCRKGFKIGPLVADDNASAEVILMALAAPAGGDELYLDVPETNVAAVTLAKAHGLVPIFETARMYTGPVRPMRLDRVFGVTSFELG